MPSVRYTISLDAAAAQNEQKKVEAGFVAIKEKAEAASKVDYSQFSGSIDKLIAGLDRMGLKLDSQNEKIKKIHEATSGFDKIGEDIRKFIESPLSSAGNAADKLAKSLGPVGIAAASAVGVLGTLGAVVLELEHGYAAAGEQTVKFAERLGITAGQARDLEKEARIVGVDIHSLESSVRIMSNALEDSEGAGKKAASALARMGIDTRETSGAIREAGPVTLELIDYLSKMTSHTDQVREGTAALGKGYKEIIPLVEHYAEVQKDIEELGGNALSSNIESAARAEQAFTKLDIAFGMLKNSLARKLLPITVDIVARITRLVAGNPNDSVGDQALGYAWKGIKNATGITAFTGYANYVSEGYQDARALTTLTPGNQRDAHFNLLNTRPQDLMSGFNERTAQAGFLTAMGATTQRQNAAKNAAILGGNDPDSLREREQDARTAYETARKALNSDSTDKDRQQLLDLKKTYDGLEAQIKATKQLSEEEKKRHAEIEAFGKRMNQVELTPLQKAYSERNTLINSPGMTAAQKQQIRSSSVLGIARLTKQEDDKRIDEGNKALSELASLSERADPDYKQTDIIAKLTGKPTNPFLADHASIQATSQDLIRKAENDEKYQTAYINASGGKTEQDQYAKEQAISDLRKRTADYVYDKELHIADTKGAGAEQAAFDARVKHEDKLLDIQIENMTRLSQLQQKQFDSIKEQAEQLMDVLFNNPKNFGSALLNTVKEAALKPIKEAVGGQIAHALAPSIYGQGGQGGIAGLVSQGMNRLHLGGGSGGSGSSGGSIQIGAGESGLPLSSIRQFAPDLTLPASVGTGGTNPYWQYLRTPTDPDGGSDMGQPPTGPGSFPDPLAGLGLPPGGLSDPSIMMGRGPDGRPMSGGSQASLSQTASGWGKLKTGLGIAQSLGGNLIGRSGDSGPSNIPTWDPATNQETYKIPTWDPATNSEVYTTAPGVGSNSVGQGSAMTQAVGGIAGAGLGMFGSYALGKGLNNTGAGSDAGSLKGVGWDALGGAALGMQYAGPVGAAVGAATGAAVGLAEMAAGVESQGNEAVRMVKQIYGLKITYQTANQIVQLANSKYSGHVSEAVRDPDIKKMMNLYAVSTGQKIPGVSAPAMAGSLLEQNGGLMQQDTYQWGQAQSYQSSLPTAGGYSATSNSSLYGSQGTVQLIVGGDSAAAFMNGQISSTVNPGYVQDQYSASMSGSDGRVSATALSNSPGLITH